MEKTYRWIHDEMKREEGEVEVQIQLREVGAMFMKLLKR